MGSSFGHSLVNPPTETEPVGFFSLFKGIWREPRETIRTVLAIRPNYFALPLILVAALSTTFYQALAVDRSKATNPLTIGYQLLLSFGAYYLLGWLLSKLGGYMNGPATPSQMWTTLAWSSIPGIIGMLFGVIFLLVNSTPLLCLTSFVPGALGIWAMVTMVRCVSEVQRFSTGKTIGYLVVGMVILFVVLFAISFPVMSLLTLLNPGP